jgi:hypothetical protein
MTIIARSKDGRCRRASALAAFAVGTTIGSVPLCAFAQVTLHTSLFDPVTGAVTESKQETFAPSHSLVAELDSSIVNGNASVAFAKGSYTYALPDIQVDISPYTEADVHWIDNVVVSSPSVPKTDLLVVHGFVNIYGYRADEGLNPAFTAWGSGMTSLSYTWDNPPPPFGANAPYTLQAENGKIVQLDFNVMASAPVPIPGGFYPDSAVIGAGWGGVTSVTDATTGLTLSNYSLFSPSSGLVYGSAVPEPAEAAMWLMGVAALLAIKRRSVRAPRSAC